MRLFFTIIIPVKSINEYVRETVPYVQKLMNQQWELIILPNDIEPDEWNDSRIRIIASGNVGPAKKRDMGAESANGNVLVFLDDDSYPEKNLLDVAAVHFIDSSVTAIGGPAITPPHDTYWQKVSGSVFLSRFSGGAPERYIPIGRVKEVDDWPSVNLMVRKNDFLNIGGFNSPYWPGEDTKLCLDLIKTGKKILYVPDLIVWHHRRAGFAAHLKQVGGYGLHRGFFVKKYPETSRRLTYFIPSMFFIFAIVSTITPWLPNMIQSIIAAGWLLYFMTMLVVLVDISKKETIQVAGMTLIYVFFTHLFYGWKFIQGLLTQNLVSKYR